ncbi:ribulose bisphosphate carboxylase/oxygenase activase, chloroplastic-like isoform X4 [Panicum virgatum]|uniref:ribulose bisphosphate carboxylase/oxygenase activase, chloroplastic-like isoform X4 n=1 Tax=Panicum virgatum TaxID=38727 RepID=UPI0019D5202B|nr:ribulose bisphosphate carboxylase/oxygenase activase, chloroplastic-like isoform X4 [Panicum virgatum]
MATTSLAASSSHPHLFRSRNPNSTFRTSNRGRLRSLRCSSAPSSPQPATGGEAEESERRRLSKQSSWEAKDADGDDYLYRLGKEADNMNIAVGARAGIVDDLFVGNFLGKDSDIVFDYRQKATRTFEYLQGDYYIAPLFLDKVACHIVKNFIAHLLDIKIPLILGEPGRLIRDRYRTASQVIQNQVRRCLQLLDLRYENFKFRFWMVQGKLSCLMINDLDAGVGRFGNTQMTVNNQIVAGTLMNLADNPTRVSIGQKWRESDVTNRVPIIVTGNDFSTLYAPLIRDGRMEKFYWQPDREDIINIVHGMYTKDGISVEEVSRIVDTFPNQALDFYGALRSRTYDRAILEWVDQIGGHEKLGEKLLKQKKGEKLPTFIPPKQTLEALIESGSSLVREQELIMNSKLSKEYMKNMED